MSTERDQNHLGAFRGTGEFQLRDVHVFAEVTVRDARIETVTFRDSEGAPVPGADDVANAVSGKPVLEALEISSERLSSVETRDAMPTNVALLEAFHRAMEMFLDDA